jgi:acetyltransferase-like isoleucine patch superfamily enzyme
MRIIRKILRWILNEKKSRSIKYTIGNKKHHNSRIDELMPQYVTIGDNFISAPGSIVLSHDTSTVLHSGKFRIEKTIIGDNVFLGANSVIMPGVTIGNGVIVGAGAIVTKDVPANLVVAGNPARVICTVEEYISKCEKRNVLFTPTDAISENILKRKITLEELDEFQDKVLRDYRSKESNQ